MLRKLATFRQYFFGSFAVALSLLCQSGLAETFRLDEFQHVTFDKIPATKYSEKEGVIIADVASSSSFLLKPFPVIKKIKRVQWRWKLAGNFKVESFDQMKTKAGDDAVVRLGLIKPGDAPMIPFFAPVWVKAIRDQMKLPGSEMQYLIAGGPVAPGTTWVSPHTSSMSMLQIQSTNEADGWHLAQHTFAEPFKVVGIWLMSDGDGAKSTFVVSLKDFEVFE